MKAHPFACLFPMMSEDMLKELADDIKENGQQQPIYTLDGQILDGRNRDKACALAGVAPRYEEFTGTDPLAFVISQNLLRRHLTESQRGMVASRLATLKTGGNFSGVNQYRKSGCSPIGEQPNITSQTREDAAAALNVGTTTLDRARQVQKYGAPELVKAVDDGHVKLGTAQTILNLPIDEQARIVEAGPEAVKVAAKGIRTGAGHLTDSRRGAMAAQSLRAGKLPKYIPSDAPMIWEQARVTLERIHPKDRHRVDVLKQAMAYIQRRLDENK